MISKLAIQDYLNKPRDSFVWLKSVSEQDLDCEIAKLRPIPEFHVPMKTHQKVCFLVGVARKSFFFPLDMGTGKTGLSLELINYFLRLDPSLRFLVYAPNEPVAYGWVDEINKWGFEFPVKVILGNRNQKWDQWNSFKSGVAISTYIGLATMVSQLTKVQKKKKGKMVMVEQFLIDRQLLNKIKIDGVVFDESTKVASRESLSFIVANKVSQFAKYRYALAGRPFGRDPQALWSQFYLIDRGDTFSTTLTFFREVFFYTRQLPWHPMAREYKLDKKREPDLKRIMLHKSLAYSVDECLDLPELIKTIARVSLPSDTREYYKKLVQQLIQAKGNYRELDNIFLKMRQLSSGFIGLVDEEDEDDLKRIEIEFDPNPKMDLLLDLIDDIPEDRKIVVFYEYTYSGRKIMERLQKAKIKAGWLWGGTKDWPKLKYEFDNDPKMRVLVVNHKKGALGLNLQVANYCLFYESPVSVIDRDQAEKRIHRQGQEFKCFIYDLVVRKTMDEKILQYHQEGQNLFKAIVKDPSLILEDLE